MSKPNVDELQKTGDVDGLIAALGDKDWDVRRGAAEVLSRIGEPAVEPLIAVLGDKDWGVRWYAAKALGRIRDPRAVEPLIATLSDEDSEVCGRAFYALGKLGESAVKPSIAALHDGDSSVRKGASYALGEIGDPRAVKPLISTLSDEGWTVRVAASYALGEIGDMSAVEPLIATLSDEGWTVREAASRALGKIGNPRAVEPLIAALRDEKSYVRLGASSALGKIGDPRAVESLIAALIDEDSSVREYASYALGKIGDPRAVPALEKVINDSHENVRKGAKEAFDKIKPSDAYKEYLKVKEKEQATKLRNSIKKSFVAAKSKIQSAKSSDVKVSNAEKLLKQAESAFESKKYEEAGKLAKQSSQSVKEETIRLRNSAKDSLASAKSILQDKPATHANKLCTGAENAYNAGNYAKAIKLAEAAIKEITQLENEPTTEYLLDKAKQFTDTGFDHYNAREYHAAIGEWKKAVPEYQSAVQFAERRGETDFVESINSGIETTRNNISKAEIRIDHDTVVDLANKSNLETEQGHSNYETGDYRSAKTHFEKSIKLLDSAKPIAEKRDFGDLLKSIEEQIPSLYESYCTCVLESAKFDLENERFPEADAFLTREADYVRRIGSDDQTFELNRLLEDSRKGIAWSKIESAMDDLEEIGKLYKSGEYLKARDAYLQTEERLKEVSLFAVEYDLLDEKAESDNLQSVIAENIQNCLLGHANSLLNSADALFNEKKYLEARDAYKNTKEFIGKGDIKNPNELLDAVLKNTQNCLLGHANTLVEAADALFGGGEYHKAKEGYKKAQEFLNRENVNYSKDLQEHIKNCNEALTRVSKVGTEPLTIPELKRPDLKPKERRPFSSPAKVVTRERESEGEMPVEIRRGYEILPNNNDIRFGIRITNNTDYLIADTKVTLDYPEPDPKKPIFSLKGPEVQRLGVIQSGGIRTATYILTPRDCVHMEEIDAIVTYRDHSGKRHASEMRAKAVHCVCPFLKEKPMQEEEFAERTAGAGSETITENLLFSGIGTSEIADFLKMSYLPTGRLHLVNELESGNTIVLKLSGESKGEKVCYLLTATLQPHKEKNVTQITLMAYSDRSHGIHGFLSEIREGIRKHLEPMPHVREIKIVSNYDGVNSLRLLRDFEHYCNERYAKSEIIVEKLDLVYHSLAAAEPVTEDTILPLVTENLNAMRRLGDVEAQKERGKRLCGQLVELMHIATIGRGSPQPATP